MEYEVGKQFEDIERRLITVELYLNYLINKDKLPKVSDEELAKFAKTQGEDKQ